MLVEEYIQQGAWLIVNGWEDSGTMFALWSSLPQVCPLVTSFKCVTCRTQLALSFFQGGINVFIAGPHTELAHLQDMKKETFQTLTVLNNVNTLITRSRQTKLGSTFMTENE